MNKRNPFICGVLLIACILSYLPGLSAPFYLDDISSIVTNGYVTNGAWSNAFEFESLKRSIGSLSFFINHQFSGLASESFRTVNIAIHGLNGLLVYLLINTLLLHNYVKREHAAIYALIAMGVFLLHPINTQAVTYIVQRFTSLMTLFCLLSIYTYFIGRTRADVRFLVISFVSFSCAVLVKETALVLIPIFAAMEYTLLGKHKVISRLVFVGITSFFALQLLVFFKFIDLSTLDALTKDDVRVDRTDYFKAQMVVLFHYIKSYLGLNHGYYLEYDDSVRSILYFHNWAGYAALHLIALIGAVWLRKIAPLASFAIIGFYAGHTIESAFIPIRDVIVEHRMYFPGMFIILLGIVLLHACTRRLQNKPQYIVTGTVACALLTISFYTTYQRNELWQDKSAFYRNELRNSPHHWRIKNALVVSYVEQGKDDAARRLLRSLIRSHKGLYYPPVLLNGILLFKDKSPKLAKFFEKQIFSDINRLSKPDRAKAFYYRGERFFKGKAYVAAQAHFEQALRLYSDFPEAVVQFANAHLAAGDPDTAKQILLDNVNRVSDPTLINDALAKFAANG